MNFLEFFSPLFRQKVATGVAILASGILVFLGINLLPESQKTTLYFSVKILEISESKNLKDPPESAAKLAETIAGWAKDPGFRAEILTRANAEISGFKRKISARKQNQTNLFWTIKLPAAEQKFGQSLADSLVIILGEKVAELSENALLKFELTPASFARETQKIPTSWAAAASIFAGLVLGLAIIFGREILGGKVCFASEIRAIFPKSKILKIPAKPGQHDSELIEKFVLAFERPKMTAVFAAAGQFFRLSAIEDTQSETPILLVQMGKTSIHDLESARAIFGKRVGIIVFEK